MNFTKIMLNQIIKTKQNYVTWILAALIFILKLKIFTKILLMSFDTSNYSRDDKRPYPIGKNKKKIGFFKDELGGKIIKKFVGLRAITYAYLMNDDSEKKSKKNREMCNK